MEAKKTQEKKESAESTETRDPERTPGATAAPEGGIVEAGGSVDGRRQPTPRNEPAPGSKPVRNLERILDIQLPVTVSFGATSRPLSDILKFAPGTLVELDRGADEPVVLKVNGKVFAWGRVVDVDGYYGVEITQIVNQVDRIASLGGE